MAQTTVFSDDFTAPPGFAPAGYTVVTGNTDFNPGSSANVQIGGSAGSVLLTPNQLAPWVSVGTSPVGLINNGFAQATAPLSTYTTPFNTTIGLNTQIVSWTFNMRTGLDPSGLGDGFDNAVAILACDNPDVRNAGSGYAVMFDPALLFGVQLVKYTGGLLGTVTPIISSGPFLFAPTNYTTIRVVFDPSTTRWTLFVRDDGTGGFSVPSSGVLTPVGVVVDASYTSIPMTTFGFYANYSAKYLGAGPDAFNAYFDNYSVTLICADITGELNTCIGSHTKLSHLSTDGTWSSMNPAVATVIDTSGWVTGVSADTVTIIYSSPTCYTSAVVTVAPIVATPVTGDTALCRGESSTFATATFGGAWSNIHTTLGTIDAGTGTYTSLLAGTDTVIYTLGLGCTSEKTITVDSVESITGTATVCPGTTTTMANVVAGGTWSSADITKFTVASTTGVVTGVAAGVADITYTTPFGCTSHTPITVNALPAAITGDTRICVGNSTTLSNTSGTGTWASSDVAIATIDASTGSMTGVDVGTATITYTATSTGCYITTVATIDAAPAAVTGTAIMCANTSQTLSHSVGSGTWSSSNTSIATVNSSGSVTGVITTGGNATITYTLPTSGCTATREVTVQALPGNITGSLSVCLNSNTTLSTTAPTPSWTSGNTTVATVNATTGVVTGVATGTSVITVTGTNGCIRTATVTVNPLPSGITGTATVCIAATTTLSSTSTPGTWGSGNILVATVSSGGVVTGISAGTATITYTSGGCFVTRIVTVNSLPTAFTGPSSVCLGSTVTLTSTPAGTWSSSNATTAPVNASGEVTGSATGTANITYTIANSCYRVRTMTVNTPPPAIGGPLVLCPGSSATLTNSATPGTWASGTTSVATIVSGTGVYTGVTGGTSIITYTQTSTGCTVNTTVTVSAAPPAILTAIGDTVLCPGGFTTLTVSTSPGVSYQWYNAAGPIAGAVSPTFITSAAGSYHAQVIVASGCSSTSVPMTVAVTPATATITVPGGTTATCAGTPVVLEANTGAGLTYQWELGGTAIPGATSDTYNATTSGSYAVRVTNPAGCWAVSSTVAVTASALPSNAVSASGPLTICDGDNVTFTAASGPGYTYQWHDATGAIAGATSMAYSATVAENYFVVVTNAAGCTATSTAFAVVVNPLPDVSITPGGIRLFCIGSNVVLDAALGFDYQWYKNGTPIPAATNSTYLATTGGGYRVMVTDPTTGCSDMTHADTIVTVISGATTLALTPAKFCWGGSALLSTSVSGLGSALNYQWQFNGSPIGGANGPTLTAAAVGLYHCVVNVPGSCTISTNVIEVSSVPLPNPIVSYNGSSVRTGNYYIAYQWYKDLLPITGATSWSTPVTGNGNYKVAVTDTNGCQSVSATYVLTDWKGPTAVTSINDVDASIFPNPASNVVNIISPVSVRALISSVDGKALIDVQEAKTIDIKGLADGIYIITLFDGNGTLIKTQKLIKQQ
ncbi:hypothetical protein GCM10023093_11130 [Nemorincola caseinilytica]|uniref:BIG2 domain-containing protein n=1 Tax=Nemorincola caseinilytica TaxID=2054315 RepID=A0ABP8N8M2_9BACT